MARKPARVFFLRPVIDRTAPIKERSKKYYVRLVKNLEKRPLGSFFAILLVLFALIAIGKFLDKPEITEEQAKEPILVEIYSIGSAPRITVPAQIEKEGVVQIEAQTSGIVHKINVKDGQSVKKGQNLISLASNYQGANAASVSRQLAGIGVQTAQETFNAQKDIVAAQRELAEKSDSNQDELRSIADKSIDETRSLVSLNESILTSIENDIRNLEATNVGGANDALILQSKQLRSQFLSATIQARSALRNTELQADEDKPPTQLSNLQREIAIKQLDLQEKTLKLSVDSANLQLKLAQINESTFFPASPFGGSVEKVHVRVGQQVSPGTLLVTISQKDKSQTAVAYVPKNIASQVSKLNSSILTVENKHYEVLPLYISQEAVKGQLYAIIYEIPDEAKSQLTDKGFIDVEVPIGYSWASVSTPYIPLDAVHQTQDVATVFVVKNERAEGKAVTLGQVQGNFIEVTAGLEDNDIVIVNRNIVSGDPVKAKAP